VEQEQWRFKATMYSRLLRHMIEHRRTNDDFRRLCEAQQEYLRIPQEQRAKWQEHQKAKWKEMRQRLAILHDRFFPLRAVADLWLPDESLRALDEMAEAVANWLDDDSTNQGSGQEAAMENARENAYQSLVKAARNDLFRRIGTK
jgi:hypothetical protein